MADHLFGNILLGGRGANAGQLKIHPKGFLWKKSGGGKVVEVSKDDVKSISWTKIPRGYQLSVKMKAGCVKFNGFREQDVTTLNPFFTSNLGVTPEEKPLAVSGRNWGEVELEGNTLSFIVGGKQAFEVSVTDVSQSQVQGKNDVTMEFHVDDTAGANEKDALMEISFHVPNTNTAFIGDEERPSAQVFCDRLLSMADVGSAGGEAVAAFNDVTVLTPRGRYLVEMHFSYLRLIGANDFKIQYTSVVRIFILPRPNQSAQSITYVVITLDPPIRKGQTFYPHIVIQYPSEEITELTPQINEDQLNTKYKERLELQYKDLSYEVFCKILRGLAEARISRPGKFRSSQGGYAVRASLKAEEGLLYPLEKSFFFLPKPPTLILHEEIEYVEFERHGAGTSSISSKNFDIHIRLKNDQEHQFRNILRNEYAKLYEFFSEKGLKILNFATQESDTAVAKVLRNPDEPGVDPHLIRIARETEDSDEEDEDFVAGKEDEGSPTDDSGEEEEPDASESEEETEKQPVTKKEKEKKVEPTPKPPAKATKRKEKEDQGKKNPKKRKKDPNAPKRALTGFMYFCQDQRENLKKTNPGIKLQEQSKVLGERWKGMSAEEREPFEKKARADKARWKEEMKDYKGGAGPSKSNSG